MKRLLLVLILTTTGYTQSLVLDSTFGTNGFTTSSETNLSEGIYDIALQSDGKIIANLNYRLPDDLTERNNSVLIRYNQNGSIDSNFGNNGKYYFNNNTYFENRSYFKVLNNDKIIVIYTNGTSNEEIFLTRLNSNGTLDTSFGQSGIINVSSLQFDFDSAPLCLFVQPDNKILVGGVAFVGNYYDAGVVRFNENGQVDTSFGNNGLVTIDTNNIPNTNVLEFFSSIVIQSDGKIVLGGGRTGLNQTIPDIYDFLSVRLNQDGSLDQDFGNNGVVVTSDPSSTESIQRIVLNQEEEIIVMGTLYDLGDDNNYKIAVAKYNSSGVFVPSFGTNGIFQLETNITNSNQFGYDLDILADGKLLISGFSRDSSVDIKMLIAKLNQNGSLDTTFSNNGIYLENLDSFSAAITDTVILPDDSILIAGGFFNSNDENDCFLARLISENLVTINFDKKRFEIYPNPTTNLLNITDSNNTTIDKITLTDLYGKILIEQRENLSIINVEHLPQGIYFMEIDYNGEKQIEKFIKQ